MNLCVQQWVASRVWEKQTQFIKIVFLSITNHKLNFYDTLRVLNSLKTCMGFSRTEEQQNRSFVNYFDGVFLWKWTEQTLPFLHAIRLPILKSKARYLSEIKRRLKRYKIRCLASSIEVERVGSVGRVERPVLHKPGEEDEVLDFTSPIRIRCAWGCVRPHRSSKCFYFFTVK
jgi:hypothetical protein